MLQVAYRKAFEYCIGHMGAELFCNASRKSMKTLGQLVRKTTVPSVGRMQS